MSKQFRQFDKGALELIEEAVHLLRCASPSALAGYLVGTLPFVVGFLYFWAEMSRSAFAEERCSGAAIGLGVLFLWMKCWQNVFALRLRVQLTGATLPAWTSARVGRLIATQAIMQPTGLFVLPIALLVTIPFGWCFAFYQNLLMSDPGEEDFKAAVSKAAKLAGFWPGQNHLIFLVLAGFSFFVWLNVMAALWQAPFLLKTFLGVETVFTQAGPFALANTTLLAMACVLTWLCVDPLLKAVYLLRCFYGESMTSGADLRMELKKGAKLLLMALVAFVWASGLGTGAVSAAAAEMEPSSTSTQVGVTNRTLAVSSADLNRSINEVLAEREFAWRMPRVKLEENAKEKSWWIRWLSGLAEMVRDTFRYLGKKLEALFKWVLDHMPKPKPSPGNESSGVEWAGALRLVLVVLIIAIACVIAVLFLRMWRRRRVPRQLTVAEPVPAEPDLRDESVVASQLPEEGWLKLARELAEKGELRLALRALYLASLAHLAGRELIAIAKFKSNCDYQSELQRRARSRADLQEAFSFQVRAFDRAWYGLHEVTPELLAEFQTNLERIRAC